LALPRLGDSCAEYRHALRPIRARTVRRRIDKWLKNKSLPELAAPAGISEYLCFQRLPQGLGSAGKHPKGIIQRIAAIRTPSSASPWVARNAMATSSTPFPSSTTMRFRMMWLRCKTLISQHQRRLNRTAYNITIGGDVMTRICCCGGWSRGLTGGGRNVLQASICSVLGLFLCS
jgi:hypothetical protein